MYYHNVCSGCGLPSYAQNIPYGYAGETCKCSFFKPRHPLEYGDREEPLLEEVVRLRVEISECRKRLDFWKKSCDDAHNNWQIDRDKLEASEKLVVELREELKMVEGQRNRSNRSIEDLRDELFELRKLVDET